jgi:hypothetical protein
LDREQVDPSEVIVGAHGFNHRIEAEAQLDVPRADAHARSIRHRQRRRPQMPL